MRFGVLINHLSTDPNDGVVLNDEKLSGFLLMRDALSGACLLLFLSKNWVRLKRK